MAKTVGKRRTFTALWRAVRDSRRPGAPGIGARLAALPRLIAARLRGDYRDVTPGRLGMIALAALYIVSPIDLAPEALLLFFGVADDALVAIWLTGAVFDETERFLRWEQSKQARRPVYRSR